ncbi:MAG: sugar-binding protein, partial [Victivallaceae bacterium]|nr:sugar-binding protein [Victivallaceae bacterium]
IRSVVPKAKIGAIRPSECKNFTFTIDVFKKAGKEFNLFPLDPYWIESPWYITLKEDTPKLDEWLVKVYQKARDIAKEYGCEQPVYVSELGCGLFPGLAPYSKYAFEQASQLAKACLISRAAEGYGPMFMWHTAGATTWGRKIKVDENKISWGRMNWGMICEGINSPMPAVPAFSAVAQLVENVHKSQIIDLGAIAKAVVFKQNRKACAAVWAKGFETLNCVFAVPAPDRLQITDYMGSPLAVKKHDSRITMRLGRNPVYFHLTGADSYSRLKTMISTGKFIDAKTRLVINKIQIVNNRLLIAVHNAVKKAIKEIELNIKLPQAEPLEVRGIDLLPEETKTLEVALPQPLTPQSGAARIQLRTAKDKLLEFDFNMALIKCEKRKNKIVIDGDLADWRGTKPLAVMNTSSFLPKYEIAVHQSWNGPEDLSATCYTAWDEDNFYLAAEITDDVHVNHAAGKNIWNGDSVQMVFNPDPVFYVDQNNAAGNGGNSNLKFALSSRGSLAFQWIGAQDAGGKCAFAVKRKEELKKTFYEIRIPFKALNIVAAEGRLFSFGIAVADDDSGSGQRYWMQLSKGIVDEINNALLKKIILTE